MSQEEKLKRLESVAICYLFKHLRCLYPYSDTGTVYYASENSLIACASRLIEMGANVNAPTNAVQVYPLLATANGRTRAGVREKAHLPLQKGRIPRCEIYAAGQPFILQYTQRDPMLQAC
jgi:hypothetical protein